MAKEVARKTTLTLSTTAQERRGYTIRRGVAYEWRGQWRIRVSLTIADLIWHEGKWLGGRPAGLMDLRGIFTRWRLFGERWGVKS